MEATSAPGNFRTFVKDAEFATSGAATLWLIADEHELTIDDGYFLVTMNDSAPFASFPALRHHRSFTLSFVDGHAEALETPRPRHGSRPKQTGQIARNNVDWLRLKQSTTMLQ